MSAASGRWRRLALKIVGHAAWMLPGARSGWADAMRREIDYIDDDRAALRWAIGCVTASYAARLTALAKLHWRISPGPVLAGSALLLIAMALQQGHASDEAPPAALAEKMCERLNAVPELQASPSADQDGVRRRAAASGPPCLREQRATGRSGRWNESP